MSLTLPAMFETDRLIRIPLPIRKTPPARYEAAKSLVGVVANDGWSQELEARVSSTKEAVLLEALPLGGLAGGLPGFFPAFLHQSGVLRVSYRADTCPAMALFWEKSVARITSEARRNGFIYTPALSTLMWCVNDLQESFLRTAFRVSGLQVSDIYGIEKLPRWSAVNMGPGLAAAMERLGQWAALASLGDLLRFAVADQSHAWPILLATTPHVRRSNAPLLASMVSASSAMALLDNPVVTAPVVAEVLSLALFPDNGHNTRFTGAAAAGVFRACALRGIRFNRSQVARVRAFLGTATPSSVMGARTAACAMREVVQDKASLRLLDAWGFVEPEANRLYIASNLQGAAWSSAVLEMVDTDGMVAAALEMASDWNFVGVRRSSLLRLVERSPDSAARLGALGILVRRPLRAPR